MRISKLLLISMLFLNISCNDNNQKSTETTTNNQERLINGHTEKFWETVKYINQKQEKSFNFVLNDFNAQNKSGERAYIQVDKDCNLIVKQASVFSFEGFAQYQTFLEINKINLSKLDPTRTSFKQIEARPEQSCVYLYVKDDKREVNVSSGIEAGYKRHNYYSDFSEYETVLSNYSGEWYKTYWVTLDFMLNDGSRMVQALNYLITECGGKGELYNDISTNNNNNNNNNSTSSSNNYCDSFSYDIIDNTKKVDFGGWYEQSINIKCNSGAKKIITKFTFKNGDAAEFSYKNGNRYTSQYKVAKIACGCD